jgi:hypothetical protein
MARDQSEAKIVALRNEVEALQGKLNRERGARSQEKATSQKEIASLRDKFAFGAWQE